MVRLVLFSLLPARVEQGVDPNQIVEGLPLLTHAVLGTQGAIGVRLLLKHNADPDVRWHI